jgi:hypothetical protein
MVGFQANMVLLFSSYGELWAKQLQNSNMKEGKKLHLFMW